VRRAIIDQDNDVPAGVRIGWDIDEDRRRFHVTESGIVVVPAGYFPARTAAAMPAAQPRTASRPVDASPQRLEELA
jgi:glucose-1-phosphate adenylyltransferase